MYIERGIAALLISSEPLGWVVHEQACSVLRGDKFAIKMHILFICIMYICAL